MDSLAQQDSAAFDCEQENWGFENGSLDGWNSAGSVYLINSGIDPYGGFSWRYPQGGQYSVKLSSDTFNVFDEEGAFIAADFARLSRQIEVPAIGTTYLSFHFAMCIFNYPHTSEEASKFTVRFLSEDSTELACPSYTCYYSSDTGPQGVSTMAQTPFSASFYNPLAVGEGPESNRVTYSDWNDVTLDLTGYAGQTITIEFGIDWCLFGVDWSYALVDVDCPINSAVPFVLCAETDIEVCGPSGMAWYEWRSLEDLIVSVDSCFAPQDTGVYYCTFLPDDIQCSDGAAVTLEYRIGLAPDLEIDIAGADIISINDTLTTALITDCDNGALLSGITNTSIYYWEPSDDLSSAGSLQTYAQPPARGIYTFHAALGACSVSSSVQIINGCSEFVMPDIFTPNGDRFNEVFKPSGQFIQDYLLLIYNRWGNLLFESTQFAVGWNGTVNNEPAPEGTYYYIVRAKGWYGHSMFDGDTSAGSFTLIR